MGVALISLGSESAIIDKADEVLVSGFKWRMLPTRYVFAQHGNLYLYIHRLITGAGPGEIVDHVNRNPLDNRTCNLRICSNSQNGANRIADRRRLGTSSRHKGVCWQKARSNWAAYIHVDGKTTYLGRFKTEDEAAHAYNVAAIEAWGEFARLNDVDGGPSPMADVTR